MVTTINTATVVGSEWTLDEFARAYQLPVHPCNRQNTTPDNIDNRDDPRWYGGLRSKQDAYSLLANGWREGATRLESLTSDVSPPAAKSRRRKPVWGPDGDELGVDRALSGDWNAAWRSSRRVWTNGPSTVDVHALIGGDASQDSEQLFWAGAACAVITDLLENAGYRVRLLATSAEREHAGWSQTALTTVVVKEADEPMRMDAVATTICHAGIYRTLMFRAMLSTPLPRTGGLGAPMRRWSAIEANMRAADMWSDDAVRIDAVYDRESCLRGLACARDKFAGGAS